MVPGYGVIDNASADNRDFSFTFKTTDGTLTTTQTVHVRVFDSNRAPTLGVANHLAVVGQTLTLPVHFGGSASDDFTVADPDGTAQTDGLTVSFLGLPEGAHYDAPTKSLVWTPGPGQVGNVVITPRSATAMPPRSKPSSSAWVPTGAPTRPVCSSTASPARPALPGQAVLVTVRASSFGAIASVVAQVRGTGLISTRGRR